VLNDAASPAIGFCGKQLIRSSKNEGCIEWNMNAVKMGSACGGEERCIFPTKVTKPAQRLSYGQLNVLLHWCISESG